MVRTKGLRAIPLYYLGRLEEARQAAAAYRESYAEKDKVKYLFAIAFHALIEKDLGNTERAKELAFEVLEHSEAFASKPRFNFFAKQDEAMAQAMAIAE